MRASLPLELLTDLVGALCMAKVRALCEIPTWFERRVRLSILHIKNESKSLTSMRRQGK